MEIITVHLIHIFIHKTLKVNPSFMHLTNVFVCVRETVRHTLREIFSVSAAPKPFTAFSRLIDSHFRMTSFKFPLLKLKEMSCSRWLEQSPLKGGIRRNSSDVLNEITG